MSINFNKERIDSYHFERINIYLPLILLEYINVNEYFRNISDEVYEEYIESRLNFVKCYPNHSEYLYAELNDWIKKYPEYEDILL